MKKTRVKIIGGNRGWETRNELERIGKRIRGESYRKAYQVNIICNEVKNSYQEVVATLNRKFVDGNGKFKAFQSLLREKE
jgi:hypothetical protein